MNPDKLRKLSQKLSANKDNYMDSFRKNIDLYVREKDITIREIAEEADIPFSTLNTVIYGSAKDCKLSTAVALARALGVSIDELIGAETIDEMSRESLSICRNLPENAVYLIRWFIRHQEKIHSGLPEEKKIISVMQTICQMNGNLKPGNEFTALDISHLRNNVRPKVFIGIKIPCDHYMPVYSPYDILLVANDRKPSPIENSVIIHGGNLFIAKRKEEIENGKTVAKYYSIRDGKFRVNEEDIDEAIGYIACVYQPPGK